MPLWFCCLLLGGLAIATSRAEISPAPASVPAPAPAPEGGLIRLAKGLVGKNGGNQLFYLPTHDEPATPADWGLKFETVHFKSGDGTRLHGWFIPARNGKAKAKAKAKATVVFSHGNAGALGYHLGFVTWWAEAGYNVLMYDYRGFGKSAGTAERRGVVDDVKAAFAYVATRPDVDASRLVSYGHSLGGASSVAALGESPVRGLRAVIIEGAFASYRGMAQLIGGQFGASLVSDELAPKDFVAKLSPVPLLVVHGTRDEVVPVAHGRELFASAKQPKTFFEVEAGRHGDSLSRDRGAFRHRVLTWLEATLRS